IIRHPETTLRQKRDGGEIKCRLRHQYGRRRCSQAEEPAESAVGAIHRPIVPHYQWLESAMSRARNALLKTSLAFEVAGALRFASEKRDASMSQPEHRSYRVPANGEKIEIDVWQR